MISADRAAARGRRPRAACAVGRNSVTCGAKHAPCPTSTAPTPQRTTSTHMHILCQQDAGGSRDALPAPACRWLVHATAHAPSERYGHPIRIHGRLSRAATPAAHRSPRTRMRMAAIHFLVRSQFFLIPGKLKTGYKDGPWARNSYLCPQFRRRVVVARPWHSRM